jgi:hypothetical protein
MIRCRKGVIAVRSKKLKITLSCIAVVIALIGIMLAKGIIVFDHSAQRIGENDITWKGVYYFAVYGKYREGKTIAKTNDGFNICEVEGDDSHTFVGLRSFLDNWLLVREDYVIPIYGEITRVYWNMNFIEDEEFLSVIAEILEKREADFIYNNSKGDIYQYKGDDVMRELVVAYEGCPVPTNNLGYMGTIDGKWCITVGNYQKDKIDCYYIPEEYIPNLEKYWS